MSETKSENNEIISEKKAYDSPKLVANGELRAIVLSGSGGVGDTNFSAVEN